MRRRSDSGPTGPTGDAGAAAWQLESPPVGTDVVLVADPPDDDPDGRPTAVDDARDGLIAVHAPPYRPGELEPPADGARFTLRWTSERGRMVLPVVLRERVRTGVPLWWLEPDGPLARQQRRSFVRAQATGPLPAQVELAWEMPSRGLASGALLDLSEGGLRALVTGGCCPAEAAVAVRLTVVEPHDDDVELALDVIEHELAGTVLRARLVASSSPSSVQEWEVVVQLHDDVRQGNALRALVFAWQRRARRP